MSNTHHTAFAVLDTRFFLHTLLTDGAHGRTYRATDVSGLEVLVVVLFEADLFFDSLARLYAVDGSPYFAECLYNYPPAAVSGRPLPLDRPLPDPPAGSDPGTWGLLILEQVDGTPLVEVLAEADEMEQVDGLLELTRALQTLHHAGLCHGGLQTANVLRERDSGEIRLVDLGGDPAWWCEGDPESLRRGAALDVRLLARHFLRVPKKPGRAFKKFRKVCLAEEGTDVPGTDEVIRRLKDLRRRHSPRKSLEILFGFLKPMHLVSWLVVVWFTSLAINRLMGDGRVPVQQKRAEILTDKHLDGEARLARLRDLYMESADAAFRERLAADMSAFTREHVVFLNEEDAATPIAVLAFKSRPAVITRHSLIRIGDWVEVGDKFGYVAEIEYNRIKIAYENASSRHFFQRPPNFRGQTLGTELVIVWPNPDNLDCLLEGLAEVFGLNYVHRAPTGQSAFPSLEGRVSGIFRANGGFDTFLEELNEALDVRVVGDDLIYQSSRTQVPVYYKAFVLTVQDKTMEELGKSIERIVGMPVRVAEDIRHEPANQKLFNVTWQEFIQALGLKHTVVKEGDALVLLLEKNPSQPNPESKGETR